MVLQCFTSGALSKGKSPCETKRWNHFRLATCGIRSSGCASSRSMRRESSADRGSRHDVRSNHMPSPQVLPHGCTREICLFHVGDGGFRLQRVPRDRVRAFSLWMEWLIPKATCSPTLKPGCRCSPRCEARRSMWPCGEVADFHCTACLCAAALHGTHVRLGARLHEAVYRHALRVVGTNRPAGVAEILWDSIRAV